MTAMAKSEGWRATHEDFADEIFFAPSTLKYLHGCRQRGLFAREAGGQLFGARIATGLQVMAASGPYKGDTRTRTSYRSNPAAANGMIDDMRARGFIYLGEWHTHPEKYPRPSGADVDAFIRLCAHSERASATLILAIQGQATTPMGLTILTLDGSQLVPWKFSEEAEK